MPEITLKTSYEKIIEKDKEFLELIKDINIPQFKDVPPKSEALRKILFRIKNLRPGAVILLLGETGTGKELIARYISEVFHSGEMVVFNIARSGNQELFYSSLFGYKKGAFTGAEKDTNGYVDEANEKNAILFLDEVDKLSLESQHTLLRFIETREYSPLGGTEVKRFDGTIVLAGNAENFKKRVEAEEILKDFYYRISTHLFNIPSLRERPEDILPLTRYYLMIFNERYDKNFETFDEQFQEFLLRYNWPGNIRELMSFLEKIIPHYDGNVLKYEFIPDEYKESLRQTKYRVKSEREIWIEQYEEKLKKHKGNVSAAAKELQIPHTTLRSRLKRLGINPNKFKHW